MLDVMKLADGTIVEKLNRELEKISQNIIDKNTYPKKERKITLTLSFKPTESRDFVKTTITTKTTLATETEVDTIILVGKDGEGNIHLNEARQQSMFDSKEKAKITNIK